MSCPIEFEDNFTMYHKDDYVGYCLIKGSFVENTRSLSKEEKEKIVEKLISDFKKTIEKEIL